MVEGSLWLYGTDLADLYRGEMTLRQLWVRLMALPVDSPFKQEALRAYDESQVHSKADEVEAALARFGR